MNATATRHSTAPQALLSMSSRVAAVVAVCAVLVLVSLTARQASHQAVQTAAESFSRGATHVTLAPVQIVGRRASVDAKS
jgi:hypothetical protein